MRHATDLAHLTARRWVSVYNQSGEIIPGYACMKVSYDGTVLRDGAAEPSGSLLWHVDKPDTEAESNQNPYQLLFNGPLPIGVPDPARPGTGIGIGTMDFPVQALYRGTWINSADPTTLRQTAGPKAGQWQLELGLRAFSALAWDFSCAPDGGVFASLNARSLSRAWFVPRIGGGLRCMASVGQSSSSVTSLGQHLTIGDLEEFTLAGAFTIDPAGTSIIVPTAGVYRTTFHCASRTLAAASLTWRFTKNGFGWPAVGPQGATAREHPTVTFHNPGHGQSIELATTENVCMSHFIECEAGDKIGIILFGSGSSSMSHGQILIESV